MDYIYVPKLRVYDTILNSSSLSLFFGLTGRKKRLDHDRGGYMCHLDGQKRVRHMVLTELSSVIWGSVWREGRESNEKSTLQG